MKRLVLFDIDGTLVHSNRTGRTAVSRALTHIFGTPGAVETYDFAGKTDRRIVLDLMTAEGKLPEEIEALFSDFVEQMAIEGRSLFTPDRIYPCPGVLPLLEVLRQRKDVVLALLTGNVILTAPLKLRAAGIDPALFGAGAYGSDRVDRDELMEVVLDRVHRQLGLRFAAADIVVIGDTPADIRCARTGHTRALAVATGPVSVEVLRRHAPDYLFADLSETTDVLNAIFDPAPLVG